ncbi:MAG: exosortase/archaeosortase family protein [Chthoniobacter sp.]|nr:exosortase/archaeosortase family protein [Chthoniobacter sp.]
MEEPRPSGRTAWLTALVFVAPWLLVIRQLRFFWTLDQQYSYGWSVPLLALALFYFRWRDRPPAGTVRARLAWMPLLVMALLLLPLRLVQEATPDWSVINWLLALTAVGFALSLLTLLGGWDWARWFAFPCAFLLTAVPWPQRFELAVTGGLMRWVAAWTVEVLGWFGVPAWASGHLIHLPAGVLGVDEACSGVRSLQALLMVSLFLGEVLRFSWRQRLGLGLAGLLFALPANFMRTLFLSLVAARRGIDAVAGEHDAAGIVALVFALLGTLFVALRMLTTAKSPSPARQLALAFPALPVVPAVALLVWFAAVEVGVEYWYRCHETGDREWTWSVRWPEGRSGYRSLDVPLQARRILLCDSARGAAWDEPDGRRWILYWLRWEPGRTASQSARMHRPETCLPATGAVLQQDLGVRAIRVGSRELPFHLLTFVEGQTLMHVFFCLDEQAHRAASTASLPPDASRWQRVLAGQRNLGQQSLEAALIGYPSTEAAIRGFSGRLSEITISPEQK